MSARKATESRLGVDFQDVSVLNLMIGTDHASRAPVHTTDEATTLDMKTADKLIAWGGTGDITVKGADGAFRVEAGANIEMKAQSGFMFCVSCFMFISE